MSDDMIRRLDLVQSYFVREGLGFDEKCIAIEEARDLIKAQALRLGNVEDQNRHMRAWIRELRDTQEDRGHEPADPLYSMLLERIEQLMQADPAADSIDGARLLELVGLCEAYETRQGQRALGLDAENKALQSRLGDLQTRFDAVWQRAEKLDAMVGERDRRLYVYERRLSDCESALRSLDVGRESSYWAVEKLGGKS